MPLFTFLKCTGLISPQLVTTYSQNWHIRGIQQLLKWFIYISRVRVFLAVDCYWRSLRRQSMTQLIMALGSLARIRNRGTMQWWNNDLKKLEKSKERWCLDEFIYRYEFFTNIFHSLDNGHTLSLHIIFNPPLPWHRLLSLCRPWPVGKRNGKNQPIYGEFCHLTQSLVSATLLGRSW